MKDERTIMEPPTPWWLVRPIAHRGLHDNPAGVPENSLAAFAAAGRAGFPVELDVTLTRDGRVVVFHDEDLERMTGHPGRVRETPAEVLRGLALLGGGERVPLLGEVFDLLGGAIPILIELKSGGGVGATERAVWHLIRTYQGPLAVESFDTWVLAWFRRHAPAIERGQLAGDGRDAQSPLLMKIAISQPRFIAHDVRHLPFGPVAQLRKQGTPILGWTVKSRAEMTKALRHCDNVIFEGFVPDE